jgi:uncharacterized membrane protein
LSATAGDAIFAVTLAAPWISEIELMSDDPMTEAGRHDATPLADSHPAATAAEAYAPAAPLAPDVALADPHEPVVHEAVHMEPAEVSASEAPAPEVQAPEAAESRVAEPAPQPSLQDHPVSAPIADVHTPDDHVAANPATDAGVADVHAANDHLPSAVDAPAVVDAMPHGASTPVALAPVHDRSAEDAHAAGGHGRLEALAAAAVVGGLVAAADHVMHRASAEEAAHPQSAPIHAETARPTMPDAHAHPDAGRDIDPLLAGFDHVVALAGYGLLFASVFMFGVPALASVALAYAHHGDAHLVARTHYRFQIRIFWTSVLLLALALGAAVVAGGVAIGKIIGFAQDHLPGISGMMAQAHVSSWSGAATGGLVAGSIGLFALAALWTLFASVFGFLRLLSNRPIGHLPRG